MSSTAAHRPKRRRAAYRLLLSLLLALAPFSASAAGMPMLTVDADASASTTQQMPCHPERTAQSVQSAENMQQDACPHCTGDGPASQCHCCGYAAPAGLGLQADALADSHPGDPPLRMGVTDPLPDSPGYRPFRPPIFHS